MRLAEEAPVDADIVIPYRTPGYPPPSVSREIGHPIRGGTDKEPLHRQDFHPAHPVHPAAGSQAQAEPAYPVIAGKKLVIVDDSIVRGTTAERWWRCSRTRAPARCTCGALSSNSLSLLLRHRYCGKERANRFSPLR